MSPLSDADCLALWDALQTRHPLDRGLLLAAQVEPRADWADQPLGQAQAALLHLQRRWFGHHVEGLWVCAECGQALSLPLDLRQLPAQAAGAPQLNWRGLRFRLPSTRDLMAASQASRPDQAADILLQRIALDGLPPAWEAQALAELETELDQADPLARLCTELECLECGAAQTVELDPLQWLEQGLARRAALLLDAVHRLAQAYGWSEDQVLGLSPARRQAYLARVAS